MWSYAAVLIAVILGLAHVIATSITVNAHERMQQRDLDREEEDK